MQFNTPGFEKLVQEYFYLEPPSRSSHECIIRRAMKDTSLVDQIFDNVVYVKGTLVIKQLYFLLGE